MPWPRAALQSELSPQLYLLPSPRPSDRCMVFAAASPGSRGMFHLPTDLTLSFWCDHGQAFNNLPFDGLYGAAGATDEMLRKAVFRQPGVGLAVPEAPQPAIEGPAMVHDYLLSKVKFSPGFAPSPFNYRSVADELSAIADMPGLLGPVADAVAPMHVVMVRRRCAPRGRQVLLSEIIATTRARLPHVRHFLFYGGRR